MKDSKEGEDVMAIPKQGPVISIDGPAGTGKSSVTRRLAAVLGYVYVDTGALYRAIAWESIRTKVITVGELDPNQPFSEKQASELGHLAQTTHIEFRQDKTRKPVNRVLVNSQDVTDLIRTPEMSMAASKVSAVPTVRLALLSQQRRLGCVGRAILEGRDIGTVIFPDADLKVFLTANVAERAKRRLAELEAAGAIPPSFEEVKKQIAERDTADQSRSAAPLKKAKDAVEIDTSDLTLDEVVEKIQGLVAEKIGNG